MRAFESIALDTDPAAHRYVKNETVQIVFAQSAGEVISSVGRNRYEAGDALVTGSNGDRWSVTCARFEDKYEPVAPLTMGRDGPYRAKPVPVLAKQIAEPFSIPRRAGGDVLRGAAGDWILQYARGDFGLVDQARFAKVYRLFEVTG